MGAQVILLKHATTQKIALAGTKPGLVITAFWYLGVKNINVNTIQIVMSQLTTKE